MRADRVAHHLVEQAVGIGRAGRRHAAVVAEIHAVERPGGLQAPVHVGQQPQQEAVVDRPGWLACGDDDRHRLPGAGLVHFGDEGRQLRRHRRGGLARLGEDRIALQIAERAEIGFGRYGSEGIAFKMKAK